jgi:hypothetical protein
MTDDRQQDISMHHIPIRGGIGAAVLIAIIIAAMLVELPQLRWPVLGSAALGLIFAVALILWRRRSLDDQKLPPGAHTLFVQSAAVSGETHETHRSRPVTPPGAHPRVVPAS